MIFTNNFLVSTYRGGPSGYDNGNWTNHSYKKDAIECAKRVHGNCYKIETKGKGYKLTPVVLDD